MHAAPFASNNKLRSARLAPVVECTFDPDLQRAHVLRSRCLRCASFCRGINVCSSCCYTAPAPVVEYVSPALAVSLVVPALAVHAAPAFVSTLLKLQRVMPSLLTFSVPTRHVTIQSDTFHLLTTHMVVSRDNECRSPGHGKATFYIPSVFVQSRPCPLLAVMWRTVRSQNVCSSRACGC